MHPTNGITIPALYARITRDGAVTCSATLRPLGTVKWAHVGHLVSWVFTAPTGERGERSTQRAAVQALRDLSNARAQHPLPLGPDDERPIEQRATERIRSARGLADRAAAAQRDEAPPAVTKTSSAAPTQRIAWGDHATDVADLTSAIQRAFDRHKESK